MTDPHDPDTPLTLDVPDPFTCEGDCGGCGARSAHLNRWDLCRACVDASARAAPTDSSSLSMNVLQ